MRYYLVRPDRDCGAAGVISVNLLLLTFPLRRTHVSVGLPPAGNVID